MHLPRCDSNHDADHVVDDTFATNPRRDTPSIGERSRSGEKGDVVFCTRYREHPSATKGSVGNGGACFARRAFFGDAFFGSLGWSS